MEVQYDAASLRIAGLSEGCPTQDLLSEPTDASRVPRTPFPTTRTLAPCLRGRHRSLRYHTAKRNVGWQVPSTRTVHSLLRPFCRPPHRHVQAGLSLWLPLAQGWQPCVTQRSPVHAFPFHHRPRQSNNEHKDNSGLSRDSSDPLQLPGRTDARRQARTTHRTKTDRQAPVLV